MSAINNLDSAFSKYIFTLEELEANGTPVGNFAELTYTEAMHKVKQVNPDHKLVIGIKFLPGANEYVDESPYEVRENEWVIFQNDLKTMSPKDFVTKVYAVPRRFSIPI